MCVGCVSVCCWVLICCVCSGLILLGVCVVDIVGCVCVCVVVCVWLCVCVVVDWVRVSVVECVWFVC